MKNFFIKIWKIIRYRVGEIGQAIHIRRMRKNTAHLKKSYKTDYRRWKKQKELLPDWDERTLILAGLIDPGAKIIEFGAGNMSLKAMLPHNCEYTPSDITARSPDFLICDLNEKIPFELIYYDTAVFSGVMEYVYDIEKVFEQLSKTIRTIVLSYACVDISNSNRLNNGWLSDYSKNELDGIFEKFGYKKVSYSEWRRQSIYKLEKISN